MRIIRSLEKNSWRLWNNKNGCNKEDKCNRRRKWKEHKLMLMRKWKRKEELWKRNYKWKGSIWRRKGSLKWNNDKWIKCRGIIKDKIHMHKHKLKHRLKRKDRDKCKGMEDMNMMKECKDSMNNNNSNRE